MVLHIEQVLVELDISSIKDYVIIILNAKAVVLIVVLFAPHSVVGKRARLGNFERAG